MHSVVPAPAGLFPDVRLSSTSSTSRPRARGAVPATSATSAAARWSSPRPRGCSATGGDDVGGRGVVPAPAGLFPGVSP